MDNNYHFFPRNLITCNSSCCYLLGSLGLFIHPVYYACLRHSFSHRRSISITDTGCLLGSHYLDRFAYFFAVLEAAPAWLDGREFGSGLLLQPLISFALLQHVHLFRLVMSLVCLFEHALQR